MDEGRWSEDAPLLRGTENIVLMTIYAKPSQKTGSENWRLLVHSLGDEGGRHMTEIRLTNFLRCSMDSTPSLSGANHLTFSHTNIHLHNNAVWYWL